MDKKIYADRLQDAVNVFITSAGTMDTETLQRQFIFISGGLFYSRVCDVISYKDYRYLTDKINYVYNNQTCV